ncbi:hypothetical protein P153DRAFT_433260 [Dothidotthia symphoricarpi CBS 119687]|uniref:Uncharacterized protein n=1 Tax=Dothidotthia symphoricarpi CBS 119687 TaxID=1392245 RepID=A0A6A6A7G7_9PLEO|nr:uncharacterized protein P153DRAFT_433260 [Dothidotthia symphoricarpi CBS 119687]KAF2126728.1 hypothetical protein P153DRAFT_433260 [Dothidotthia symphoricarpi CBS 119687]
MALKKVFDTRGMTSWSVPLGVYGGQEAHAVPPWDEDIVPDEPVSEEQARAAEARFISGGESAANPWDYRAPPPWCHKSGGALDRKVIISVMFETSCLTLNEYAEISRTTDESHACTSDLSAASVRSRLSGPSTHTRTPSGPTRLGNHRQATSTKSRISQLKFVKTSLRKRRTRKPPQHPREEKAHGSGRKERSRELGSRHDHFSM